MENREQNRILQPLEAGDYVRVRYKAKPRYNDKIGMIIGWTLEKTTTTCDDIIVYSVMFGKNDVYPIIGACLESVYDENIIRNSEAYKCQQ